MKNYVDLALYIHDYDDITHQELTAMIGLQPIEVQVKGERRYPQHANSIAVYNRNRWIYKPDLDQFASFDDQMDAIYEALIARTDVLKPLSEKYHFELSCAVFIYVDAEESTPSVHLDEKHTALAKELKFEFDVDIMLRADSENE